MRQVRPHDLNTTSHQKKPGAWTPHSTGAGLRVQLRGMSYAEGVEALSPFSGPAVHEAAARGVQGAGSSLPFLSAIQTSFGHHDVSHVSAHVGGDARSACASIGARAYATGDRVAFGSAPDLHTAAHEAAHVVQQRAGVSLSGGVGASGDRYEHHADAVADRVVRGQSAEALLDRFTGGRGGAGGGAVQRLAGDGVQVEMRPELDVRVGAHEVGPGGDITLTLAVNNLDEAAEGVAFEWRVRDAVLALDQPLVGAPGPSDVGMYAADARAHTFTVTASEQTESLGGTPGTHLIDPTLRVSHGEREDLWQGPVQRVRVSEEPTRWQAEQMVTMNRFNDLCDETGAHAMGFMGEGLASEAEASDGWETALVAVSGGVLGGVFGALGACLIQNAGDRLVRWGAAAVKKALDAGKSSLASELEGAIRSGRGNDLDNRGLATFCAHQSIGMMRSFAGARDAFIRGAGTQDDQRMTLEDMLSLQAALEVVRVQAEGVQRDQMVVGWMNLIAGDIDAATLDLQDVTQTGVLGVEFQGHEGVPTRIARWSAQGLNSTWLERLRGTRLGDWTSRRSEARSRAGLGLETGPRPTIDLIARTVRTTEPVGFQVSADTAREMARARVILAGERKVYFGLGRTRDGQVFRDWEDLRHTPDNCDGQAAGHYFLDRVQSIATTMRQVEELTLN